MTEIRPWIAYVAPVGFPEGGAAARRILGNAKALVSAGYDVVVVSGQLSSCNEAIVEISPGIRCVSVNERDSEHLPKILRYARYALMGTRSRLWLDAQMDLPTAVILYSGYSPYLLQFMGWSRRNRVPLLFDAVEWYQASSLPRFLFSPYFWNTEFAMRVLISRLDGVVAISRAMESYYNARGIPVGRVPPLFDPAEIVQSIPENVGGAPLKLVYSGSPGHKDLLDIVIEAVIRRDAGAGRLRLDIAGLTEAELCARKPVRDRGGVLPNCLVAHGRVTHVRSLELVGQADFTVFLRHANRMSTYGFSTKFVESFALGTPVITNITSDLGEHLREEETGLICPEATLTALDSTLVRALSFEVDTFSAMRAAARKEAETAFSYLSHADTLGRLINSSKSKLFT